MKNSKAKMLGCILTAVFFAGSSSATNYSEKTFLMPRAVGDNMAMEYTTWHSVIRDKAPAQSGVNLDLTGFYQQSNNKGALGRYFGIDGSSSFVLNAHSVNTLASKEVNYKYMFHRGTTPDSISSATIKYSPKQTVWGARLDYYQNLDCIIKGLFLKAHTPLVQVKNDMGLGISNTVNYFDVTESSHVNLYEYFKGNYENLAEATLQSKLTKAKMAGHQKATGFADVDVALGYKLLDKQKAQISFDLLFTIPTGNSVKGEYVFEPIVGNGKHWAVGAGFDGQIRFWSKNKQNLELIYGLNYKYLFSKNEKRTLSFNSAAGNYYKYSQYYLVSSKNRATDQPLIPAANVLTRDIHVTPGSQLEGVLQFAYNNGGFTFDLGYNLFCKQSENVRLANEWDSSEYAVTALNLNTHTTAGFGNYPYIIAQENLNLDSVKNPDQFTHKIYGGLGYAWKKASYNILLGIGGSYEAVTDNNELSNWALWLKAGLSF